MPAHHRDLRTFLQALRAAGVLLEIEAEVDPHLEMAEIHRRVIACGGPALLFKRVKGSPFAAVSNLFGTAARVELAFGSAPRKFIERLARLPHTLLPPTLSRLWQERDVLLQLARTRLKTVRRAPVTERSLQPDLHSFPATQSWFEDGGRFFTLPMVHTQHPLTGSSNLGLYRMQLHGAAETGMHWQIGKGGGFHHHAAEQTNSSLPVNVYLGGPPGLILSAIAPLPENVPELLLAALCAGGSLRMTRNPAGPLPLVADAEVALVGSVPAQVRRAEGPFGDHYGYYSLQHDYPVFQVDRVFCRRDAVIPFTVVGKPRQEDFFLGDHLQELLRPLFPIAMPSVEDLWSYGETGYHALSAAVVRERYKREAMVSAFRILGEGQLSLTKFLIATDSKIDLRDFRAVLTHVLERADFATDLFVFANLSMDSLDYCGPRINHGSKGVLLGLGDARRQLPRHFEGAVPPGVTVAVFSPGCLCVSAPTNMQAADLARLPAFAAWPLLALVDDAARAAKSTMNFLWTVFTRFDPAADLHAAEERLHAGHVLRTPPLVIDARMKPNYPAELFCDDATARLVSRRWREYFPSGQEMGDSDRAHLD
ncbi:MAG: UbiD family decarboxylase [Planctomycetes bacterium]|nr:UbiD family decarboxylase [Planctomycetota bacterium]